MVRLGGFRQTGAAGLLEGQERLDVLAMPVAGEAEALARGGRAVEVDRVEVGAGLQATSAEPRTEDGAGARGEQGGARATSTEGDNG
jgi:hypothetical protein